MKRVVIQEVDDLLGMPVGAVVYNVSRVTISKEVKKGSVTQRVKHTLQPGTTFVKVSDTHWALRDPVKNMTPCKWPNEGMATHLPTLDSELKEPVKCFMCGGPHPGNEHF